MLCDTLARAWDEATTDQGRRLIERQADVTLERIGHLQEEIAATQTRTLAGAAVQLRRLGAMLDGDALDRRLVASALRVVETAASDQPACSTGVRPPRSTLLCLEFANRLFQGCQPGCHGDALTMRGRVEIGAYRCRDGGTDSHPFGLGVFVDLGNQFLGYASDCPRPLGHVGHLLSVCCTPGRCTCVQRV